MQGENSCFSCLWVEWIGVPQLSVQKKPCEIKHVFFSTIPEGSKRKSSTKRGWKQRKEKRVLYQFRLLTLRKKVSPCFILRFYSRLRIHVLEQNFPCTGINYFLRQRFHPSQPFSYQIGRQLNVCQQSQKSQAEPRYLRVCSQFLPGWCLNIRIGKKSRKLPSHSYLIPCLVPYMKVKGTKRYST